MDVAVFIWSRFPTLWLNLGPLVTGSGLAKERERTRHNRPESYEKFRTLLINIVPIQFAVLSRGFFQPNLTGERTLVYYYLFPD